MPAIKEATTRQAAIKIVKDFVQTCKLYEITFDKVILFGSAARNKMRRGSDIDVLFVSDIFKNNPVTDRRILNKLILTDDSFIGIESHPYPTDYFEKGDPFIDEIKRTGVNIPV